MRLDLTRAETLGISSEILAFPEIPDLELVLGCEVAELDSDFLIVVSLVEKANGPAVLKLPDPNLARVALRGEPLTLLAEWILVDSDNFPVGKDLLGLCWNLPKVDRKDKRGSEDAPDRELCPLFLMSETRSPAGRLETNKNHVRIVPVARASVVSPVRVVTPLVNDGLDGAPFSADIVPVPPHVAVLWKWSVVHFHVVGWPAAAVDDWPAGLVEEVHHGWVGVALLKEFGVAAVHLKLVNFPLGEGAGIGKEVTLGTGVTAAGEGTVVVVDTKLDTLLVSVVSEPLDAVWETGWIWIELVVFVSAWAHPAVVDINKGIAVVEPAVGRHVVDHVGEEFLGNAVIRVLLAVDLAAELFPLHPAHRRSPRKTVVQRRSRSNQRQKHELK